MISVKSFTLLLDEGNYENNIFVFALVNCSKNVLLQKLSFPFEWFVRLTPPKKTTPKRMEL